MAARTRRRKEASTASSAGATIFPRLTDGSARLSSNTPVSTSTGAATSGLEMTGVRLKPGTKKGQKLRSFGDRELREPPPAEKKYVGPGICPYCGSSDLTTLPESYSYMTRTGCVSCNRWFNDERKK
jgi:hypothetical protein